jgi:SAM-dependent methyltransferase
VLLLLLYCRYYGCGTPLPLGITGLRVLDLGSGTGRDCYVAARLVGPSGFVTGGWVVSLMVSLLDQVMMAFLGQQDSGLSGKND